MLSVLLLLKWSFVMGPAAPTVRAFRVLGRVPRSVANTDQAAAISLVEAWTALLAQASRSSVA